MPPPPEHVQQRIDAAILDAARASRPAPRRETAPEPKPASVVQEQPADPPSATAAPETPEAALQETPIEEEPSKTEAEVVAEKVAREEAVAEEALPSKHQEQRWHMSKRVQERMDELLAKAALVSHKVNNFTGTDYSGIERLRRDIIDQGISCHSPSLSCA
jgi:sensitive to high expression protein 9